MKQIHGIRTVMIAALLAVASITPALAADETTADEQNRQLMQRVEQLEKRLAEMEQAKGADSAASSVAAETEPPAEDPIDTAAPVEETTEAAPAADEAMYAEPMGLNDDRDVTYGTKSSFLTWHGYLNFEFHDRQGAQSTFDNHEFYLATKARMSERVGFTAEFEYEHSPEKLILPIQAFADLKVVDALTLRAGIWFSPIGLPRGYNLRGNRNRMIRQVALTHDLLFENWADVGVGAFGEFKNGVFYDVAVGNGTPGTLQPGDSWFDADKSLQSHSEDNNDDKALHSRFGYHSTRFAGGELNAAVSYGTQKYDPAGEKSLIYEAFDVRYLHRSGWRLQAEYLDRSGDDNDVDLATGMSADAEAWYVQLSKRWMFHKKWARYIEPVVQVDWIDWNVKEENNHDQLTTAVGLIFSPVENYLLKFEYDFVDEKGPSLENNKLWLAVVVEF